MEVEQQSDTVQQQSSAQQPIVALEPDEAILSRTKVWPAKVRFLIWLEAIDITTKTRQICELNCQNNSVSYRTFDTLRVIPVLPNGMNYVFVFSVSRDPDLSREFMREIKDEVVLFRSPQFVPLFSTILHHHFAPNFQIPKIRIGFSLFRSRDLKFAPRLSQGMPRNMAHGYFEHVFEDVFEHVQSWMHAVQTLAGKVTVEVKVNRPWTDYRSLRGLTSPLRRDNGTVEVIINQRAWDKIPDREFHIGLTVGALQGMTMLRQLVFTEDGAKILVDHGCRGFRG